MIQAEDIHKWYGTTYALKGVTFSVEQGEIVGLLGPNGAGKTTMMRILTGYLKATSGSVSLAGFSVTEDPLEVKRRIGYLPEIPPLYEDMVVTDYLRFVAELKGVPKKKLRERVQESIERTGCGEVANRLISHISKGFRQRVGIAQAIVHNPDVVILDEPTIGLDPRQIIEIRNLISTLGKDHTVLLSSHILPEVSATCQRMMIIHHGEIIAIDTQEKLTERLQGSARWKVTFRGSREKSLRVLEAVGLHEAALLQEQQTRTAWSVAMDKEEAMREKLFFEAAEQKIPIVELSPETISLEEVFLQLTKE